jgi:hypothetical protein
MIETIFLSGLQQARLFPVHRYQTMSNETYPLLKIVRWRTGNCRLRCSIKAVCCSFVSIGTNRIDGRVTASQIAAASFASFLLRVRSAFT